MYLGQGWWQGLRKTVSAHMLGTMFLVTEAPAVALGGLTPERWHLRQLWFAKAKKKKKKK